MVIAGYNSFFWYTIYSTQFTIHDIEKRKQVKTMDALSHIIYMSSRMHIDESRLYIHLYL